MTRHQRLIRRRLWAGLIVIVAVFTIFGARLFQIQGIDSQAYATMAAESGTQTIAVPAPRGKIVDRNDVALAANTAGMTLTADPSMTRENATENEVGKTAWRGSADISAGQLSRTER